MRTPGPASSSSARLASCVIATALSLAAASALAQPVVVSTATPISFPVTIEALGNVRANEAVEIRAQIAERVTAIHFSEGGQVEAGAVLVELDATRARADVAAARAAMVESEAQLRRAAQLREARSLSQAEYDARLAERDARRAALAVAEAALEDTTVRAPFEGRVGLRRVSVGSLVDSGTVITTLDDTDPVKIDFDVPETLLGLVVPGAPIHVRSAAFEDERFTGRVDSIDTRVDPISRDLTVRGVLPNPHARLRPGMFVTVTLTRDEVEALVVPEQAIVPEQSRQFVYVVDDSGRAEKRLVRTGRRQPGLVEVLGGLSAGDRVVAEGTQRVRGGEIVDVVGEIAVETLASRAEAPIRAGGDAPRGATRPDASREADAPGPGGGS